MCYAYCHNKHSTSRDLTGKTRQSPEDAYLSHPPKAEAVIRLGSPNTVSLMSGLVGYWTFDGSWVHWNTGTVDDMSGHGNTGQLLNMSTTTSLTAGRIGQAIDLLATGSVSVPISDSLKPLNVTVSAWVKLRGGEGSKIVASNDALGSVAYGIDIDPNIEIGIDNYNCDVFPTGALTLDQWQHVAFTYDGAKIRTYLNGRLISTVSCTQVMNYAPVTKLSMVYEIGRPGGKMDDVRVYNRALGAAEIKQLYNLGQATPKGTILLPWQDRKGAGKRPWYSITSSSDGTKLAAVEYGGYVYTSTDSGVTWTDQTNAGLRQWESITSSSDGTKLAATTDEVDIYTSTDGGANWTDQTAAGSRDWYRITSSSDGMKLAATVVGGDIYTSTDGGAIWTDQTNAGSRNWRTITSSSDGTKLAAVAWGGDIYTSTDSGANWTDQTAAGSRDWYRITSSSDGMKLAAVEYGGDIYTSTDGGATWTDRTSAGSRNWGSITSSSDGMKLAASVILGGDIYTSTNGGLTWTDQTAAGGRNWGTITSSSDGTKLAAVVYDGDIWTTKAGVTNIGHSNTNFLSSGLVGYWTFDGGSMDWRTNTAKDSSGNGNTGTLVSMSTTTSPTPGKIGQALFFDGVNDYVNLGKGSSLDMQTGSMSISLWINPKEKNERILSDYDAATVSYAQIDVTTSSDNNFAYQVVSGGINSKGWITPNDSSIFGTWYHVVVTRNGAALNDEDVTIYINGVVQTLTPSSFGSPTIPDFSLVGNLAIGRPGDFSSTYLKALVDDVRIYNRVLSASEVKLLYSSGR